MISVIIPIYNVECYISSCIQSILEQDSIEDIEVVLVDDGSEDDSFNIAYNLLISNKIKNIKVGHQENKGLSSARNHGLRLATKPYVIFLDADDYIEPHSLSKVIEKIRLESYDILKYGFVTIENDKRIENNDLCNTPSLFNIVSGLTTSSACFQVFKKTLFTDNNVSFKEDIFYEDVSTVFKLYYYASNVTILPVIVYNYVSRCQSITSDVNVCKISDLFSSYDEILCFFSDKSYSFDLRYALHLKLVRISIYLSKQCFKSENSFNLLDTILDNLFSKADVNELLDCIAKNNLKDANDFYYYVINGQYNIKKGIDFHVRNQSYANLYNFRISENINKIFDFFSSQSQLSGNYAVYGDGLISKLIINAFEKKPVVVVDIKYEEPFVDSVGLKCSPKYLGQYEFDTILITSLGREFEIAESLKRIGVSENKIKFFTADFV